ncbi:hypothetical protein Pint_25318 [Pistacia integerrima]|uniref:Uncharacterized protein n=1 Tax=Pistacia integerrima TaxID=434235 RepID=A0ACC0YGR2_9ROSI|nr:hypothetical protein Pint_25318 [Pistacia integerrima]
MRSETSGTAGKQLYRYEKNVLSSNRVAAERNMDDKCAQTGEEFSSEFLRDRTAQRRITVMNDGGHRHPTQMGFNFNQNNQAVYRDLNGIHGSRRKSYECNADVSDMVPATGCAAEIENNAYNDNLSRYPWQYGAIGQNSGKFSDEIYSDQVTTEPTVSPHYIVGSPLSYHYYGPGFMESALSQKIKFLCSFGGRILPRPNDSKLRYVGGETRIISIRRNLTWVELVKKTSAICNQPHTIKYQLPGEDLDALISVCSDEDLHHMIEEHQELERIGGSNRLRIFLVPLAEPESPSSLEGRDTQQSDPDYQYVFAVNGMLNVTSRRNSSGQSLASQATALGTASDHSVGFYRDSPTSIQTCDNKDYSSNSSNFGGTFFNRNVQHRDTVSSNAQINADQPCAVVNGSANPLAMDKFSCVNPINHYDNLSYAHLQLKNNHQQNKNMVETEQTNRSHEMHFQNHGPGRDTMHYTAHSQRDKNSEGPALKERSLSDTGLHEQYESSIYSFREPTIPQSPWTIGREKSPMVGMLSSSKEWPMQRQEVIDEKNQGTKYKNQCIMKTPEPCKNNFEWSPEFNWMDWNPASSVSDRKHHEGSVKVMQYGNAMEYTINNQPSIHIPLQDSHDSGSSLFSLPVIHKENSAGTTKENLGGCQLDTNVPKSHVKRQNATSNQKCAMAETSQPDSLGSPGLPSISSEGAANQERRIPRCKLTRSYASSKEDSIYNEEARNSPHHRIGKIRIRMPSGKDQKSEDPICAQSQASENDHEDKTLKSGVIVKDVTDSTPPDIPSSLVVVPHVQHNGSDEYPSQRETDAESMNQSDGEEAKVFSNAAMAELEADIYGLQIIKNDDLEELQELGSGTYGTVYHGKWRGTDVAIKRIKKSCFSGRSSERDRLTKDFWRETQILSNLHHPNVVAFYGVVPDGPGGTMATVTEYMVNGSLRHVLLRKDRSLDRRKKLMIAMDAAFGMEYLHFKNIVHFDLKCDNLLVNLRDPQRPICKVGDFGLSRIKRNTLVSGGVRGTLPWMAPELLNGSSSRVSEKVDVFSFGIAMWELLTGEEPYANMHCGAIIGGIVSNTLRPPIPEHCDPEWKRLLEECWSFDPSARPSFTEITKRLRVMSTALQTKRLSNLDSYQYSPIPLQPCPQGCETTSRRWPRMSYHPPKRCPLVTKGGNCKGVTVGIAEHGFSKDT